MREFTRSIRTRVRAETGEALDQMAGRLGTTRCEVARRCLETVAEEYFDGEIADEDARLIREFVVTRSVLLRTLVFLGERAGATEREMVALFKAARERGQKAADEALDEIRADLRGKRRARRARATAAGER